MSYFSDKTDNTDCIERYTPVMYMFQTVPLFHEFMVLWSWYSFYGRHVRLLVFMCALQFGVLFEDDT